MQTVIRNALGVLVTLASLGTSSVHADCNLSKVSVSHCWIGDHIFYPDGNMYVARMYYQIDNQGQDGCDLKLRYLLQDNEDPPERQTLQYTDGRQFVDAGQSQTVYVDYNFDSRDYPDLPGAKHAVDAIWANGETVIWYSTEAVYQCPKWPGE